MNFPVFALRPGPHAALLLLAVAVLIAYHNSLSGPFVFDDRGAILDNPSIRQLSPLTEPLSPPTGGRSVSGRPLVNLSFAINYSFGRTNPRGYHAVNILIHVVTALTLFGVVRRTWPHLARLRPPGASRDELSAATISASFALALLWALHPLQTASVTYVAQRAESLMGLFYLLTLYLFIRGVESSRPWRWFAPAILTCFAGMACKEVMATAPLLLFLYDRTFVAGTFANAWHRRRSLYFALASTWPLLALLLIGTLGRGGTVGLGSGISSWHYLLTQSEAITRYLGLSFWPYPQVFDHGERVVTRLADVLPQALLVLALLAGTLVALWRRPMLGFLGAWFFAILAPTSSIVPVASQTIAEHRMYLPLAAVVALVVAVTRRLAGRQFLVPLLVIAVAAGTATLLRNRVYGSEIDLWAESAARAPANVRAHLNHGSALLDAGRDDEAAAAYEQAARLQPDAAEVHDRLCHAYTRLGRLTEAVTHGEAALRLQPDNADAHVNLAATFVQLGQTDKAIVHYSAAVRLQPEASDVRIAFADALLERAQLLGRQGKLGEARLLAAEARRIAPEHPAAHFASGNLAAAAQDFAAAIAAYQRALELAPDYIAARNNLANALLVVGRAEEAIVEYERVLQQRPDDASIRANLEHARALRRAPTPPR